MLKRNFKIGKYILREFSTLPEYLFLFVYKMRNHPKVGRYSFSKRINLQEHFKFRELLKSSSNRFYWLVLEDKTIIGVISVSIIGNSIKVGLYKNPYNPKAKGKILLKLLMDIAFILKKRDILLEVHRENKAAINLYNCFGFKLKKAKYLNGKFVIYVKNLKPYSTQQYCA